MRILIVEDSPKQIQAFKDFFQSSAELRSHTVDFAKTFLEYRDKVKSNVHDLVITDLFIPYSKIETRNTVECKSLFQEIYTKTKEWGTEDDYHWRYHDLANGKSIGFHFKINEYKNLMFSIFDQKWRRYSAGNIEKLKQYLGDPAENYSTAPFGIQIFWEMYYEKNVPVQLVTSDHCHDSTGSLAFGYLQKKAVLDNKPLPYLSVRGRDLRLTPDAEKPSSTEDLEVIFLEATVLAQLHLQEVDTLEDLIESFRELRIEERLAKLREIKR